MGETKVKERKKETNKKLQPSKGKPVSNWKS